jgi:hypothetical protein
MHVPGQARRDRPNHRPPRTQAEMTLDHTKVPGSHHGVLPCPIDLNDGAEAFRENQRQGLWAPAFAGATYERCLNKIHENDGSAHGRGRRRGDRPP